MPLHLTKVAYGCASLAILESRLASRGDEVRLTTRYRPKRESELAGGSLFWIIAHKLVARSPILRFEEAEGGRTNIVIEPRCIRLAPLPRRAHQGWRYLEQDQAPADLAAVEGDGDALPPALLQELTMMGLV